MNRTSWFPALFIIAAVLGFVVVYGGRERGNTPPAEKIPKKKVPPTSSAPATSGGKCPPPLSDGEHCRRAGGLSACLFLEVEE